MTHDKLLLKLDRHSREFVSLIVLVILSALSHFWLIMYFICCAVAVWGLAGALMRLISVAAGAAMPRIAALVSLHGTTIVPGTVTAGTGFETMATPLASEIEATSARLANGADPSSPISARTVPNTTNRAV